MFEKVYYCIYCQKWHEEPCKELEKYHEKYVKTEKEKIKNKNNPRN